MRTIKLILPGAVLVSGIAVCTSSMYGTQEYAKKEKKSCTFCHGKMASDKAEMAKNLNANGACYKDNNHSLSKCEAQKK
jgi:hypothetical protein